MNNIEWLRMMRDNSSLVDCKPRLDRIADQIEDMRQTLQDCLITMENNQDGLDGAQVGLFIGRLRTTLYK